MKIIVVSMTSWGEMGNWLSGKSLGAALAACFPEASVDVLAAEELVPRFAATGEAIKEATRASRTPDERVHRYSTILRQLEADFPPGFEADPALHPSLAADLERLGRTIQAERPDVILGTKGIICRVCIAAAALVGEAPVVINYVTNHGHFQFPVHHCPGAALHLLRFPEGAEFLKSACGLPDSAVRVVGYLVAAYQLTGGRGAELAMAPPGDDRGVQSVIIVSNRGGAEYLELLEHLIPYGDDIEVTFIGINDAELCGAAERRITEAGIKTWRSIVRLGQAEFFHLMARCRSRGVTRLVCKASPNSIFEAVYFGIPMFLLRTGLPMEEWGAEMIARERIGWVADSMSELLPSIDASLRDRASMDPIRAGLSAFRQRYLDQEETLRALRGAVADCLRRAPG